MNVNSNSFGLILILPKGLQEDQNIIMSASLAPECNKVKEHVFYQINLWPRQKAEPHSQTLRCMLSQVV